MLAGELSAVFWAEGVDRRLNRIIDRKVRAMEECDNVDVPLENSKVLDLRNFRRRRKLKPEVDRPTCLRSIARSVTLRARNGPSVLR